MKKIVCYCSGGMGNRLRPLSSCYAYAKKTNRTLVIFWENIVPNGCLAKWKELFQNDIEEITMEEMSQLSDCKNFVDASLAVREQSRGIPVLKTLTDKYGASGRFNVTLDYDSENVVFYCNNFMPIFSVEENTEFLKQLKPVQDIQDNINKYEHELGLNKSIIGAHVRGTDFGKPFSFYTEKIDSILSSNKEQKIFLCSDDLGWENKISDIYPNNIIRRKKNTYIFKKDESLPWQNHNSFEISSKHAQEGIEDMFLLSKTDLKIYHPESTFAEIALYL